MDAGAELRKTNLGVGFDRPRSGSSSGQSGAQGGRRMSKVTEIRPKGKDSRPLMEWLYEHFDKATIGLVINFAILIILLMLLKNFLTWLPDMMNKEKEKFSNKD